MTKQHIAIGIDPGYDRVGWAVGTIIGSKVTIHAFGCITTSAKNTYITRLGAMQTELARIVEQYKPTKGAIESLFFAQNKKTALAVAQARGVILSELLRQNVAVSEFTPLQIKQSVTGSGRADKKAMEKMVRLQCALPATAIIDDTIDAIGILLTLASSRLPTHP